MQKLTPLYLIASCLVLSECAPPLLADTSTTVSHSPGSNGEFNFTLSSPATTSAGGFRTDGTLIKTLCNDIKYTNGTYTKSWDGTDDRGAKITSPDATYEVKVLTNNVQVTWQGTIGNTSTNMTGPKKHRGYYACMRGLVFTDTYGYFCTADSGLVSC